MQAGDASTAPEEDGAASVGEGVNAAADSTTALRERIKLRRKLRRAYHSRQRRRNRRRLGSAAVTGWSWVAGVGLTGVLNGVLVTRSS